MVDGQDSMARAKEHVGRVRDFWYHFMVYAVIGVLLIILDRRGGEASNSVLGLDWAYWVLLFWGLGVAGHAVWAFFDDHRAERLARK